MDGGADVGGIPCLLQGLLREPLDAGHVEPADGGQVKEDAGAVAAGTRHGGRLVQQGRRPCRVAGVEVVVGRLDASSEEFQAVLGRCQRSRQLQQLGGRVWGAPTAGVPACLLQRSGHIGVWTAGGKGKVPGPLLRVDDQVRQAAMHAPPGLRHGRGVDGRPQEGVGEREPATGSLQDARLFGPPQIGGCPVRPRRRRDHQVLCRTGGGGHDEEPIGRARRERGKPRREQPLEIARHGERFPGCWPDTMLGEGPSDLEREQRVAFGHPVDPQQDGVRETPLGSSSQKAGHRLLGQPADGQPVEDRCRPGPAQAERVAAGADAQRHQDPDRRILQTADHERQRPGRGHIQPLDIVDGDEHRTGRGQRAQDSQ
jgi:hypothetical protein